MMNKNSLLNIFVSPQEVSVLKNNTCISAYLLKRMIEALQRATQKQNGVNGVKRVKISYSLKELDKVIAFVANKANQKNSSNDIQYTLDNMFGRFAKKYNTAVDQLRNSKKI